MKKIIGFCLISVAFFAFLMPPATPTNAANLSAIDVWWPQNNVTLEGTQPFKFLLNGQDANSYVAYWQVDGGQLNYMDTNYNDYPHKESLVNLTGWNWKGSGPYTLTFSARDINNSQSILSEKKITIYVNNNNSDYVNAASENTAKALFAAGAKLYAATTASPAFLTAQNWALSRPNDARIMSALAAEATARWFGNWNQDVADDINNYLAGAGVNEIPTLVLYNVPKRDCNGYSAGGSVDAQNYKSWINQVSASIGSDPAIVILEPDALPLNDCLSSTEKQTRYELLKYAVDTLKNSSPAAKIYIDAGHVDWISPTEIADRLNKAGIAKADGFSLNVSNFYATTENISYGEKISNLIGNKHFVVDTSRNGLGSNGDWCNPSGRALGNKPALQTGNQLVDAYLWIKVPGESDGFCNSGPTAGSWWPQYALDLAKNAGWQ